MEAGLDISGESQNEPHNDVRIAATGTVFSMVIAIGDERFTAGWAGELVECFAHHAIRTGVTPSLSTG